jgi:hypothetical protein
MRFINSSGLLARTYLHGPRFKLSARLKAAEGIDTRSGMKDRGWCRPIAVNQNANERRDIRRDAKRWEAESEAMQAKYPYLLPLRDLPF